MKTCPQCNSQFPDDYAFCMDDGTSLIESEQETIVQNRIPFAGQTSSLAPEMIFVCPSCGLANRADSKFCKKCGTNFPPNFTNPPQPAQVQPFMFPSVQNPPQPQNSSEAQVFQPPQFTPPNTSGQTAAPYRAKSNKNSFLIIGALLGAVIIGAGLWFANQPNPLEAKLDKAITNNKLFEPAGDNAFEHYQNLKKEGVDEKVLKKFDDRIFPLLTTKPDEIIKTVVEIGVTEKDLNEWQTALKMLEWAKEIRPAETQIAAKAAYCKGRVNYINDNKSAAIEEWKKAADLDKKWAVPVNGIGLIYNEQKNYEEAKKWLRQAIERDANWAIPYNNLGTAHYHRQQYDEAAKFYRKAVELAPRWARPHAWLGSIGEDTYDYQLCISEFEIVLSPDVVGASELKLDKIRASKKKCEEALAMQNYYGY